MAPKKLQKEKRRAARLRQKAKHQVIEEEIDDETGDDFDEEEEPEAVEKEYYGEPVSFPGPTSWAEMDALKDANEKAEAVREVTWQVQDLVSNILYSEMPPKSKAKAIQNVGDGFAERVSAVDTMEKSIESLELDALVAKDLRHTPLTEKVADWISKKKLTAAAENKLSDSDFALPEKRKYPIHDKAHVRNALARAAQMIKAGGEAAADAKKAIPKIRVAAKKMGIGAMEKERNAIMIEKGADGEWRWVGWVSNNFEDHSGDIIIESAHLEYVEWVNKDMEHRAPVFTSCHAPLTYRENPVDFVAYENGFLVMSGKLTETEAEQLFTVSKEVDLGMSHTAWGLRDENDRHQITQYRIFEVTDLPLEKADNPFTTLETISKEADMNQLDYLTKLLGSEEKAKEVLKIKTSLAQKELKDAGIESKEKPAETPAAEEKPAVAVVNNTAPDVETVFKEVLSRISKELDVEGLNAYLEELKEQADKVPVLEALVKELATDKAEKLAEMIEPPAAKTLVWQKARASQSSETVLKEGDEADDKLKEAKPELGWLSEITGTQPVK